MKSTVINDMYVYGMWGYKDYHIQFKEHVNILIGPNASGKTTIINILYDVLNGNISHLRQTPFREIRISFSASTLSPEQGENKRQKVLGDFWEPNIVHLINDGEKIDFRVNNRSYPFAVPTGQFTDGRSYKDSDIPYVMAMEHLGMHGGSYRELRTLLSNLVSAVWLPVSRRLPISEEEEMARRRLHKSPLESVDECLSGLLETLQEYRRSLDSAMAGFVTDFQRNALKNILYDKYHDQISSRSLTEKPHTTEDKVALVQAFRNLGMTGSEIERRIDEHFTAAEIAINKLSMMHTQSEFSIESFLIVPLISRTRAIVEYAQQLESRRRSLFSSIRLFEDIVSLFIKNKNVTVTDSGRLSITQKMPIMGDIDWKHLSSGEKQILILLTQALLTSKTPAVYVADEPELSLHVSWQEMLMKSLTQLSPGSQFIVATHSPDIVSGFGDCVIDLGRM